MLSHHAADSTSGPSLEAQLDRTDPSGVPFTRLTPERLRADRTGMKWTRFPAEVLPLFVAEMDFTVAPVVQRAVIERVRASDTGYLDGPGELAPVFADFARSRWGWEVDPAYVHLATDVSCGILEPLRVQVPPGGRIAVTSPVYPSFFQILAELPAEIVEIPLVTEHDESGRFTSARLDLPAFEAACASDRGLDALLLCNPHNPHGLLHDESDLRALARIAAAHDVFVVSDEIHAPLAHRGQSFVPFAPIARECGTLSVTTTSASKGWNLAGVKCALIVAADERSESILRRLPPEVATRASILGLHANVAAFREATSWLDAAIAQIESNLSLLLTLATQQLPGVRITRPEAGYLVWLDFRGTAIGRSAFRTILRDARVALGRGESFGTGGDGHVRMNLACAPDTIREAVDRISRVLADADARSSTD